MAALTSCPSDEPVISWMRTKQVPAITFQIEENRNLAIHLHTRRRNEAYPMRQHMRVMSIEVVDAKEQANPPSKLMSYSFLLRCSIRHRKQNISLSARWPHHYPTLEPFVVHQRRRIFHQLELEHIDEEADGRIVLAHEQGYQFNIEHRNLTLSPSGETVLLSRH